MPDAPFVHLHVHTHYSMLDGACRVGDLVKRTKALGMDALAISDHGCMFGAVEFYNECKKEGIKPILGIEAYMAPGDRTDRSGQPGETAYHLLLLAENLEGYHNLLKLTSLSYREGFYYKPRIDKQILKQFSAGLIATSACLGGEIPSALMKRNPRVAKEMAETYLQIFGPDRFFIEVQKHVHEQDLVNPELAELARKLGVGLVATNDVHFLTKDDHHAHDVLCCVSMGKLITDENRLHYPTELYLKSPQEMQTALGQFDQAIENTSRIAAMCNVELDFSKRYAPVYRVPAEKLDATVKLPALDPAAKIKDDERYLRQLCQTGLVWRYGSADVKPEIRARLDHELKVIADKDFCSYFLIVWDFCNFARDNGIPVGARGSGVGTMVGYLLGLCNIDPLQYGLLFERFMDPSRSEMPDIDIDICQEGRQKVIEYVRNKYGHVAQIVTFGTLAAKAACKDVGRVLGVPLPEIDKLTKLIPGAPGMTLDKAMKQSPELAELYSANPTIRNVIDIAKRLEGLCRNAGVHAAGVIIADQPLDEVIPLCKDKDNNVLTQFEGPIAEKCGLLKMDFLGLRTLTTLERSLDLELQTRDARGGKPGPHVPLDARGRIDIERIPFDDPKVFELFQRGDTAGIFQFESGGMQDLLMKMVPDRIEDLIAANALYRPGPMELIPTYCARKKGQEPVPQVHPIMDRILEETYGIMVYQEQVMQIFNQLGGIELANAYKLIKAISKKQTDVIAKFKPTFLQGATANGIATARAEDLFDLILKFGGYGFNKSHSSRYAVVAYQTAYMKAYHPVQYMAALLTYEMGNTTKIVQYIEECRRMHLPVLPPDVNESGVDFTPVYVDKTTGKGRRARPAGKEGLIRFGMAAVRGVGTKAVEAIIEQRDLKGRYTGLYDFCERIDLRTVTRSTIEALIRCGAFSSVPGRRSQLLAVVEGAIEAGNTAQDDRRSGQLSMFAAAPDASTGRRIGDALPDLPELAPADLLKHEKELLGFYITSHPLTDSQPLFDRFGTASSRDLANLSEGTLITFGGMITRVRKSMTKKGRSAGMQMAMITMEDLEGQVEGVLFAETLADVLKLYPDVIANESIVLVKGKVDRRREQPSIVVNEVFPADEAFGKLTTAVAVVIDEPRAARLDELKQTLARFRGNTQVFVQVPTAIGKVTLRTSKDFAVRASRELEQAVKALLGDGVLQFHGAGSGARARAARQQRLFKESQPAPVQDDTSEAAVIAAMESESMNHDDE